MKKYLTLVFILYPLIVVFGQSELSFLNSNDHKEKVERYYALNDSLKLANSQLIETHFKKTLEKRKSSEQFVSVNLILADLKRLKKDHINVIRIIKESIDTSNFVLTKRDSIDLYKKLREAYLGIKFYSKIYELNELLLSLTKNDKEEIRYRDGLMSSYYYSLKNYSKAIVHSKKEIQEVYRLNDSSYFDLILQKYNSLGFYSSLNKQRDSGIYYYKLSIDKARQHKDTTKVDFKMHYGIVSGNIGVQKFFLKEYDSAIYYLKKDLKYCLKKNNPNFEGGIHAYVFMLRVLLAKNDYVEVKKIIKDIDRYIPYLKNNNFGNKTKYEYFENKSEFFYKTKVFDSSSIYSRKALELKKEIEKEENKKLSQENQLIAFLTKKQDQLENANLTLQLKQVQIKTKQNYIMVFMLFILITLLTASVYYVFKFKTSRRKILNQNIIIEKSLEEKQLLLEEVHHRVKNNLQVISGLLEFQDEKLNNPEVNVIIKEGQNRIQSVALIHKMMYQSDQISKVNMQDYLMELGDNIRATFDKNHICYFINAQNISLGIKEAVPLGLIFNEVITNSFKYAFNDSIKGEIVVKLDRREQNDYVFLIKDNGIGMPEGFSLNEIDSLGMDLIRGLTEQLKGELTITNEDGAKVEIKFSIE